MNYTEVMQELSHVVVSAIQSCLKSAKFDVSFKAQVTAIIAANTYTIMYKRQNYTAHGYRENIKVGDYVMVCAPQNNWSNLYIV